jgi:hypothetical protein
MIRFFRELRKSSLENGKLKNYLTYALGEILLVVVGILIALAINNTNSEADKKSQFEKGFSQLYTNIYCETGFNERLLSLLKSKLDTALLELNESDTLTGLAIPARLIYLNSSQVQYSPNSTYILNYLQENIVTQEQNQLMNQIGSYYSIFETWDELIKSLDVGNFNELFEKYGLQKPSRFTIPELYEEDIEKAIQIRQDKKYKTQLRSTINKLKDLIYLLDYKVNESKAVQEFIHTQKESLILNFEHIGILGSALITDWEKSVPMELINKDKAIWSIRIKLQNGEIKFRNGNTWNQNWGATRSFDGNAMFFGDNIPVQQGYYEITLHIKDKKYTIQEITENP